MKLTTAATACILLLALPQIRADQAAKLKKIDEIFVATKVDQIQKQVIGQIKSSVEAQFAAMGAQDGKQISAEMEKRLVPLFDQKMSWQILKPDMVKLYDQTFSEAEIDGMLAFYKSPSGKAVLEKMPVLTSKAFALSQDKLRGIMPDVMRITQEVTEKYRKQHPAPGQPPVRK